MSADPVGSERVRRPSPPPRLIRPIVRLLLQSPRFFGPGPSAAIQAPCQKGEHGSGRNSFDLSKLLKFSQNVVMMQRELAYHPRRAR
jgi:hypothetical protein